MFRKPFPEMNFSLAGMQCAVSINRQAQNRIERGEYYKHIASKMFGVPEENITPAMREAAKKRMYQAVYP